MISLSIDGKKATVEEGTSVLEAARSVGSEIPTLCYHPELAVNAACRLCTVEVTHKGRTRLTASCALPAEEGMEVKTASERVLAGRRVIIELLVARVPNAPLLREIAAKLGARTDRMEPKNEDCILCGLCVGVCSQMMGVRAIAFSGRGIARQVTTPFGGEALDCLACGACAYVCPTGAMDMERKTLDRDKAKGTPRYCRYMRLGMVPYALCPSAYECFHCEVDQRVEETLGTHPAFVARPAKETAPVEASGFSVMPERYYTAGHAWVEKVGGFLRMGVDDFGQRLVGPVEDVELLKQQGEDVAADEPLWRLKAGNKNVTMRSPVSGKVVLVNEDVSLDPALLRKAPYTRGWICMVRPAALEADLAALRFKDPARPFYLRQEPDPVVEWVNEEAQKLRGMLGPEVPKDISEADWRKVTQTFFGAQ
jgi:bidirectional [NiFe] hydrogenase diaphorase subunit